MTKAQDRWAKGITGVAGKLLDVKNTKAKARAAAYVKKYKK